MAKNDKHGAPDDELDFDFDDGDFDDLSGYGGDNGDERTPRSMLKRFMSSLKEETLSPQARRQYLHDALPQNYHTTLNSVESISDAASDLYNDSVMKEWEKSRSTLKRAIRVDGKVLRKFKLGRLVDWAEQKEDSYTSDYNPEESEVARQMGDFKGELGDMMKGGNLSPSERREFLNAGRADEDLKEDKDQNEQAYNNTTIRQQSASIGLLSRILDSQQRLVDYQDQIDFNYKKKTIEFGIRSLIAQRKALEQGALLRAEIKEGLTAITKNTGLPDYVKITSQENAKRLLRDKMVTAASDWAGSRIGGVMRAFMEQTKRNIATMGMNFRDKAGMYADGKEMLDGVGMSVPDLLMSLGAGFVRGQASKRGGKYIQNWIKKNPKYTTGLDLTEAIIANSGTYANMAMGGRSGNSKVDRFLDRFGYSGLAERQKSRIATSNTDKMDEAAFMDKRLRNTFLDVYPAWFAKIWKSIESMRRKVEPDKVEDVQYDFKFNRLRNTSDLQKEFDNENFSEQKIKNYNDGIDNWINRLDPKGTLSNEARDVMRRWLISNHAKGRESFPVELFKGEGLPKGTSSKVRREFEDKIPVLAGFDPLGVSMIMDEGVGLELKVLRQNPEYRRMSKSLGNADAQARARSPVDNRKLAEMTERYGRDFAVRSGLAQYDSSGNVNVDNDNIVKMVTGGGNRIYDQRSEMDYTGNITTIEGKDPNKLPSDTERRPFTRMGQVTDRASYDQWSKAVLQNINGPRLRGFAKGGFTNGKPDEIAGVTHGDEAVIDSEGTKQNKRLLHGIMKLGAPVIKNGKINRAYYKFLGFTSPEQVDKINELASIDLKGLKEKANKIKDEQVERVKDRFSRAKDRIKDFRTNQLHNDGYNTEFGPTPEFMGPVRTGGLRNDIQSARDLMNDPEEMLRRLKLKERLAEAREKVKNFDHRKVKETAEEYKERAKEAVSKANTSKSVDFNATKDAIDKAIQDGKVDVTKPISLFLEGQNSPFITKGDFAVARFRNKTSGHLISAPSDIMDDIVMVDDQGNFETVATMADMMEGVFDSRGRPIRLPGLEAGYRKYIKRTSLAMRAIKKTKAAQFIIGMKQKIWDDQPVDVCIIVNGNLSVVLKATGFITSQYIDAESGDVLKSHNDIRGAVKNLQGETLLTVEELSEGIFDTDGYRLKISKLKHYRNKVVTKIENFAKKQFKELRNKVLSKVLSFLEKDQSKDVYVMRLNGSERELTKAFSIEDMDAGALMLVGDSKIIKKLSDITGAVYSTISRSVVVKKDELEFGFFNEDGSPYKDWKGMSIEERLDNQKDRAINKAKQIFKSFKDKFMAGYKQGRGGPELTEEEEAKLADGDEPCDVYIIVNGEMQLKLTEQGFKDHDYRDTTGNVIEKPKDILSSVYSSAGRILLTTEQITNGLFTADGKEINTARKQAGPMKQHGRDKAATGMDRIKNLLGINKKRKTADGKDPIDVFVFHDGKMKKLIGAETFKDGLCFDKEGKALKAPFEINGPVFNGKGDIIVTEEDLEKGLYAADGKIINTKYYKANGVPGGEGFFNKAGKLGSKIKKGLKSMFSPLTDRLANLRKGSWQWNQAKREEAERNKPGDVNVTVEDNDNKEKKGFLGKLLMGLGTMFGGFFTTMMAKFGRMFKKVRNAILLSKMAGAAGGALGGGGGRGKLGLATKLVGGAMAAGGTYMGYQALNDMGSELEGDMGLAENPEEAKAMAAEEAAIAAQEEGGGGIGGFLSGVDDATGGLAGEIATTAALGYGFNKLSERRRAARLNAARPGLASRFARGAGNAAGSAASAAGRGAAAGARDAGRAGSMLGRVGGGLARVVGRRIPGAGRVLGAIGTGLGKAASWALSPRAAAGRLGMAARIGAGALSVGKFALGAARLLSGPVGWGLMAATWIGGKLWDRYQGKKNPLLRFRMQQYGFNFDDQEYSSKLLDLENLMSKFVTISGEGKPSIKEDVPEDQIFQLFEVNPEDPKNQEHVQRFVAWWTKRFKPVYLSYVKQTHGILKKFDISNIDEELDKPNKLTLLKGVNFTNKQNSPYTISASPFLDPPEVTQTVEDVQDAYDTCLKYINEMPDPVKEKAKGGEAGADAEKDKPPEGTSWLDNTKSAIKDLTDSTLKVTKILAEKTSDVFTGWFDKATTNIKGLWGGVSEWLGNATSKLMSTISSAWDSIKNAAGDVGGAVVDGATGLAQGGLDVANGIYDGVVGTYEKITGKEKDNQMAVYKAFISAGLSDNQARIMTSEVGRENEYQTRYLFGGHVDANNGAKNLGMISWQGVRATNLSKVLRSQGLLDSNGNIVQTQAALNAQAQFLVNEIKTDPAYKRTKDVFLSNPNVPYHTGVEVVGRNFIRWDYDGKKINAKSHHQKRDKFYSQISQQVGDSQAGVRAETQAAAAAQTVKPGQKQITTAEMKKLQTAAPRPATPLGPEAMKKWEQGEETRKKSLAEARNGILKGTHVLSDAKPPGQPTTPPSGQIASAGVAPGNIPKNNRAVKAATIATQRAEPDSTGFCAKYVANALQAAGFQFVRQNSAYQYANGTLQGMGFTRIQNTGQYQIGDIMVWPAHGIGKKGGAIHGHIQIYNGRNWVSDWVQESIKPSNKYNKVIPSLWRDSTLVGKVITGSVPVQGPKPSGKEAKDTVVDSKAPNKVTTMDSNSPVQTQQVVQQQASAATGSAAAQSTIQAETPISRSSNNTAATYQDATQRSSQSAATVVQDTEIARQQLAEARSQTRLLTEIRDAITGQRKEGAVLGDKTMGTLDGMDAASKAQVQLIATGIDAMVNTLKDFKKNNKSESLSDQFPVGARK